MTFEQFQATRKACADIGEAIGANMGDKPVVGFLYLDALWIETIHPEWASEPNYLVLLDRDQDIFDDLEEAERTLFTWNEGQ